MSKDTPMIIQYKKIKEKHTDAILFYRLGDFYEMFFEDAVLSSKILNITLTSRGREKGKKIPMCGVPYHSASSYIHKLLDSGHKVAICEQMEDPKNAKGPVKREVIRIITPGTVIDDSLLDNKSSNYLMSICQEGNQFGIASIDISTGEFNICTITEKNNLKNEITRINPSECLIHKKINSDLIDWVKKNNIVVNILDKEYFDKNNKDLLCKQFNVFSLNAYGVSNDNLALISAAAIINYLKNTLKRDLKHIKDIFIYDPQGFMILDTATKYNLELISNSKKKCLLGVLDYTVTSMGARMLKSWLLRPLKDEINIKKRLESVKELLENYRKRENIRNIIKSCYDFERIISKISYGNANARDLIALKKSLNVLPEVLNEIKVLKSELINEIYNKMDVLQDITILLEESIIEEPSVSLKDGNIIKEGFDENVDKLREAKNNGKTWIIDLENREKNNTGIKSLKVGFNKVFGYYIEITKANLHLVPDEYIRKQTLSNSERFITNELKGYEDTILGAEDKLTNLEYELFVKIRNKVSLKTNNIQKNAKATAALDTLLSLAEAANINNYVEPNIHSKKSINISQGRHAVVENNIDEEFIPNDILLDDHDNRTIIITGPNMAGKSTYLRQIALIVIMSHIGSFVPAEMAEIGVVDRVFTRIGASDNLSEGESTFMVEMNDVANIVNNATEKSLVILDEVGRGTSTYDGLSLAWAITEYIHNKISCRCLFATHYHELIELEKDFKGIKNYNIAVKEKGDNIIFLRQILPGGTDKSYGIHVAKLAGLPEQIINSANKMMNNMDQGSKKIITTNDMLKDIDYDFIKNNKDSKIIEELKRLDLLNTSPIEAINILYNFQKEIKEEV